MYSDYLNKLHFGSVSDGIQAMKQNAVVSQTNELDMKSLGLDSDIDKLTGKLADIQDSTDPATTIENAVSEGGAAIEGMATMKKLYSKFKDMKTKLKGKADEVKSKAQDKVDEIKSDAQDKVDEANDQLSGSKDGGETKSAEPDGENPDEFAYSSDNPGVPQPNKAQRGETDADDDVADADDDIVDGPSELNDVTYTDLPPSTSTVSENELGSGTYTNSEPSGTGEGSIEMTELNKQPEVTGDHNPEIAESDQSADRQLETDLDNLNDEATDANKTLSNDTGKLDDAIKDADPDAEDGDIGDIGDEAGEIGADVAEDTAEVGLETAGAALDATGIGSIVGIVLGIGGMVLGAVTGSEDSATKSTDETSIQNSITADQNKINQIKQQELNIKSQIAQQHFTGANIVPGMSSTTLNNVTSSSLNLHFPNSSSYSGIFSRKFAIFRDPFS